MRAPHRVTLLLAPVLLALSSCGITTTGVVEAGGPASGVVPTTPVYFVKGGVLAAVPVRTARPGDARAAVELLVVGPSEAERSSGFTTEVPALATFVRPAPTTTPGASGAQTEVQVGMPTVSVEGDAVSIRVPYAARGLTRLATQQLICTAAAAQRVAAPSAQRVTVGVSGEDGWRVKESDERCPAP